MDAYKIEVKNDTLWIKFIAMLVKITFLGKHITWLINDIDNIPSILHTPCMHFI